MFYNDLMTYLLRVNLDINASNIGGNLRFQNTLKGIRLVSKRSNRVVILAHRGRPSGRDKKLSLKHFVSPLSKGLGKRVVFINSFDFPKIAKRIVQSPNGSVFLLENLRFLKGEFGADKSLAKSLATLGDRFINDDFPTSHHKNTSNFELPKLLPSSVGPNFKMELEKLDKVMRHPRKPIVLVIGGAKIKDKLGVVKNFLPKANSILLGGAPANTVLKARGVHIGKSLYDQGTFSQIKRFAMEEKLVTPIEWEVKKEAILDSGPETIKLYTKIIQGAGTIVWNGPMGKFEDKPFDRGTKALYRAILAQKGANILIGGGDTLAAIPLPRKLRKNLFISGGGGAMLTYLSGAKLPALEAIK